MTSKLPINLDNLRRQQQVEGERIETKAGWNPDVILRTLYAFVNFAGHSGIRGEAPHSNPASFK